MLSTFPNEMEAPLNLSPYHMEPHSKTLLLHGNIDPLVPVQQSEAFTRQHRTNFIQILSAGHFDLIHPETDAWLVLVSSLKRLTHDPKNRS
ncbi:MAG: putative alpha/beta hydrolase family esterase [Parasphingorhabdus sp.]